MKGTLQEENKLVGSISGSSAMTGALSDGETMSGRVGMVLARDGKDGVDGKSAYDIALENGFEGTVKEWLDSLKGEDGADGTMSFEDLTEEQKASLKGDKGDKGDRGEQGIQGIQGGKGDKGDDGVSATHSWSGTTLTVTSASGTSSANLKGDKGDKGDKGNPGADGKQGVSGVYVGSGEMPTGYNVQINPEGESDYIAEMMSEVLPTETWTFTLSDGTTVTKKVVIL